MKQGTDVSKYQLGKVDYAEARKSGVEFGIVRLSQGTGYRDPAAAEHFRGFRGEGIQVGGYHFCDWKGTQRTKPREQAENFASAAEACGYPVAGDLTMWADAELQKYKDTTAQWADLGLWFKKFPAAAVVDFLDAFLARIEELMGMDLDVGIYTQFSFWRDRMHKSPRFAFRPLWLADDPGVNLGSWKPIIYQYEVAPRPWTGGRKVDCDVAVSDLASCTVNYKAVP